MEEENVHNHFSILLVDCLLLNVQQQIFCAYSGEEQVQRGIGVDLKFGRNL
jgi:hypothetical protein